MHHQLKPLDFAEIWQVDTFQCQEMRHFRAECLSPHLNKFHNGYRYIHPFGVGVMALQSGNMWNNTRNLNENGGNNYFELGVSNPHFIPQDLVAIFHPELSPEHEFSFYLPIELKENADD